MLLALLMAVLQPGLLMPRGMASAAPAAPAIAAGAPAASAFLPIERQPFYPELLRIAAAWQGNDLGAVTGDSPRQTLLNFYAVMTQVQHGIELLRRQGTHPPRLRWPAADRARIGELERLFALAVEALDASGFPESIRSDSADEAALQLKEVLDYVFTHSREPIAIPDADELQQINTARGSPGEGWTLPGTAITLAGRRQSGSVRLETRFSADSVQSIARMYGQIHGQRVIAQPFATPRFYDSFALSPGYLVPPRWYLSLPDRLRQVLQAESPLRDQSVLQVALSILSIALYIGLSLLILRLLLRSYLQRVEAAAGSRREHGLWEQDNLAWKRAALVLPLVLLTALTARLVDDDIGLTGSVLIATKVVFSIFYYLALALLAFLVSEALGRSLSESLLRLRTDRSDLQLRRISNLIMPVGRVLGAAAALLMIYTLLRELGLPPSTVLAFSAVPGLAIGLGASKLLGNLFAGLAIQTDRPLRVGEFCQVGGSLGFVSRIGLRSLEIQTLESRVTIPNAIADEQVVVNYSRHEGFQNHRLSQTLELRQPLDPGLTPAQLRQLLHLVQRWIEGWPEVHDLLVSLEAGGEGQLSLLTLATVSFHSWGSFLEFRNRLMLRLQELIDQVRRSRRILSIAQSSDGAVRDRIAPLVAEVVAAIPDLELACCDLLTIGDHSYDYEIQLLAGHASHGEAQAALDRFNRELMRRLEAEAIELSIPIYGVQGLGGLVAAQTPEALRGGSSPPLL